MITRPPEAVKIATPSVGGSASSPSAISTTRVTGEPASTSGGDVRTRSIASAMSTVSCMRKVTGAVRKTPSRCRIRASSASTVEPAPASSETSPANTIEAEMPSLSRTACGATQYPSASS